MIKMRARMFVTPKNTRLYRAVRQQRFTKNSLKSEGRLVKCFLLSLCVEAEAKGA